jgi:ABC-type cobalamin transport system permease subunit
LLVIHLARRTPATERLLLAIMGLFLVSGPVGVAMHFQGNVEFEHEMYPEMGGVELIQKTMTGATPVLAPGTMALLGLVGIAYVRAGQAVSRRDGSEN